MRSIDLGAPTTLGRAGLVVVCVLTALLTTVSEAARFGVPGATDPAGYFILTGPNVQDQYGDKRHALDFFIEVDGTRPLTVEIYDPGLVNLPGGLDAFFGTSYQVTYTVFDPTGTPVATRTFAADDAATDRMLVPIYTGSVPAGLYRLNVNMDSSGAGTDTDINVFGVSVPGYDFYSYHFTGGQLNLSGATITEPVVLYPWSVHSTPGDLVPLEDETGIDIINFDADAAIGGTAPPSLRIRLPSTRGALLAPSQDNGQYTTQLRGIQRSNSDCSDYGVYTLTAWDLSLVLDGGNDFNALTVQLVDYVSGTPTTDFPLAGGDPRRPRRIFYPRDDDTPPIKESLWQISSVISGPNPPQLGVASVIQVTLVIANPTTYDLTNVDVVTRTTLDPQFSPPANVIASGGLSAFSAGRSVTITGGVAAGNFGAVTYETTITGTALGTYYITGDGTDLQGGSLPTNGTYVTPFVTTVPETFGPICMVRAEVNPALCLVTANLIGTTTICAGETATLDASSSTYSTCAGGIEYRWLADGVVIPGYDWGAPSSITVSPIVTTTYTVEVRCASLPPCASAASQDVVLTAGLPPAVVGNTLLAVREGTKDVHFYWSDNGGPEYRVRFIDIKIPQASWPSLSTVRATVGSVDLLMPGEIDNTVDPSYYKVFAYGCAQESADFTDPGGDVIRAPTPGLGSRPVKAGESRLCVPAAPAAVAPAATESKSLGR